MGGAAMVIVRGRDAALGREVGGGLGWSGRLRWDGGRVGGGSKRDLGGKVCRGMTARSAMPGRGDGWWEEGFGVDGAKWFREKRKKETPGPPRRGAKKG